MSVWQEQWDNEFLFDAAQSEIGLIPVEASSGATTTVTLSATQAQTAALVRSVGANAQRVLFSFKWVPGAHGASGTAIPASSTAPGLDYPDWRLFELDKGYPVFDRCSLDDDINAASGWINRGLLFGNVVESASGFSCDVWCTRGACDTDVSVHSDVFAAPVTAQRVSIPANQRVTVAFSAQNLPPPDPLISGVTVTPSAEALGGPVQINANVTNAASVTLNGQPVTLPVTVTPTSATDTFTLVATGAPGTASAQIVIGRPGWSA
jgi:hypothetical protein